MGYFDVVRQFPRRRPPGAGRPGTLLSGRNQVIQAHHEAVEALRGATTPQERRRLVVRLLRESWAAGLPADVNMEALSAVRRGDLAAAAAELDPRRWWDDRRST